MCSLLVPIKFQNIPLTCAAMSDGADLARLREYDAQLEGREIIISFFIPGHFGIFIGWYCANYLVN